jgi:response regulator of citrate/malate metabolism
VAAVPTLRTLSTERAVAAQVLPTSASLLLEIEQNEAYQELSRRMESAQKQGLPARVELVRGRAAEAIVEAAKRLKPDLVLVDISLPGKTGLELIKEIRATNLKVKMLVVSMRDEALYANRVLRAGADGRRRPVL